MSFFLVAVLFCYSIKIEPVESNYPDVISTTQPPSEDVLKLRALLEVNKYRLEIMEMQNAQIKEMLEKLINFHLIQSNNSEGVNQDTLIKKIESVIQEKLNKLKISENSNISRIIENQLRTEIQEMKSKILNIEQQLKAYNEKLNQTKDFQETMFIKLEKMEEMFKSLESTTQTIKKADENPPKDCKEVQQKVNGVYTIKPDTSPEPFNVLCEMEIRDGGWTYVLNRFDGSQNFYLNWTDYKNGFGNLSGEFWLGLEHLYEMTGSVNRQLLVILEDWDGKTAYAIYKNFSIANENENYRLKVLNGYVGDAGDSLSGHLGYQFNTLDHKGTNSYGAKTYKGGWWHIGGGHNVQLTGIYQVKTQAVFGTGVHWDGFRGVSYSLKKAKMMIK